MKKELTIGLLTVALTLGLTSTVTAQDSSQETNVTVDIAGQTQLDVRPSSLSYTDADEGSALEPGASRSSSDLGFEHIEVENIGSERIGTVYAKATMPTQQPFGTDAAAGDPVQHNTGNFVTLSLDTASSGYRLSSTLPDVTNPHYLNRVEYFEEDYPTYIQTIPNGDSFEGSTINNVDVGRLRVGGAEYFFVIYTTGSGEYLLLGNSPHTSTELGTTDFTDTGDAYSQFTLDFSGTANNAGGNVARISQQDLVSFDESSDSYTGQQLINGSTENFANLGIGQGDISANIRQYSLYFDRDTDMVVRTRFNSQQQSPDYNSSDTSTSDSWITSDQSASGAQVDILSASNEEEALQPGENFPVNFGVEVPLGVDQNAIQEGTVTIVSNTFN